MPFYARQLKRCACGKPATEEILNHRNALYGSYCDRCAKKVLVRLEAAEAREARIKEAADV